MTNNKITHVKYMNVKISNVDYKQTYDTINESIKNRRKEYICLTDVGNLIAAARDEQLQNAINGSLFSLADGMPLVWYARMVGCKEIERISGAFLMKRLLSDIDDCKHFLLGDTEQTINRVIIEAKKLNNNIDIIGHSPPFKVFDDVDNQEITEKIRRFDPDIIWVSFGGWKQEKWMHKNVASLDRGVMIGVGAAFKFLIGDISTPPQIIQNMGLQWIFRLTGEFVENPRTCLRRVRERKLLTSKAVFIANFPREVSEARKRLRM